MASKSLAICYGVTSAQLNNNNNSCTDRVQLRLSCSVGFDLLKYPSSMALRFRFLYILTVVSPSKSDSPLNQHMENIDG